MVDIIVIIIIIIGGFVVIMNVDEQEREGEPSATLNLGKLKDSILKVRGTILRSVFNVVPRITQVFLIARLPDRFDDGHRSVIVAVVAVRVVQVTIDQIVDMIAVGHRLVSTTISMHMFRVMPFATVIGRTVVRVVSIHRQDMVFNLPTVLVV